MKRIVLSALFCMLAAPASVAMDVVQTRTAIDQGRYGEAAQMGTALASADGYALAAEAMAAPVLLGTANDQKDQAKAAFALAKTALDLDPNHVEAHMQFALSLGFITRASNPITVWRKGLANDLRAAIDAYETLAPDDARVHALRGAWHFGIVRKAGEKRAEKWYGATRAAGHAAYERALALSPHDIIIEANYALSLVDEDYDREHVRAKTMLEDCANEAPKTAVEQAVQTRMNTILARWDDKDFVRDEAARWLDGE